MDFEGFLERNKGEINKVQAMLAKPLSNNPALLLEELLQIEAHNGRMQHIKADADAYLDGFEAEYWPETTGSVEQRKIQLAGKVVHQRRLRNRLEGICRAIERRISFGQTALNHAKEAAPVTAR